MKERPSVDFQTEWRTTFVVAFGFEVSAYTTSPTTTKSHGYSSLSPSNERRVALSVFLPPEVATVAEQPISGSGYDVNAGSPCAVS